MRHFIKLSEFYFQCLKITNCYNLKRNVVYQNSYMADVKAICIAYKYSGKIGKYYLASIDFFENLYTNKENIQTIKSI
ncbi:hypothetical protein A4S05_07795 [Nostoc sp. KVJ20]|nr:hypothetical protein A4S05_07795 [Nostoc sp. KVJ20]